MKKKNKYEILFDQFLELTEFSLVKHQNDYNKYTDECGYWSLIDRQGADLGHIEGDRFESAAQILDRMDIYIHDYIIEDIQECLEEAGCDYYTGNYQGLIDYCRGKLPESKWDLDILDMIVNHPDEINLDNCFYEED